MADTPEGVAWDLLRAVAYAEGKALFESDTGEPTTRKWLFKVYAECAAIVQASSVVHDEPADTREAENSRYKFHFQGSGTPMITAQSCRDLADQCRRWAGQAETNDIRKAFLAMAGRWTVAAACAVDLPPSSDGKSDAA